MQHPRDIGALGVKAFLTMLATERKVSASTHNQALSAVFFYTGRFWALEGVTKLRGKSQCSAARCCTSTAL